MSYPLYREENKIRNLLLGINTHRVIHAADQWLPSGNGRSPQQRLALFFSLLRQEGALPKQNQ